MKLSGEWSWSIGDNSSKMLFGRELLFGEGDGTAILDTGKLGFSTENVLKDGYPLP
jgi:hypothetical protein